MSNKFIRKHYSALSYGVGALVTLIPFVGPFLALPAAMAVGVGFDKLWYGDWWKPGGKSIDQHLKDNPIISIGIIGGPVPAFIYWLCTK